MEIDRFEHENEGDDDEEFSVAYGGGNYDDGVQNVPCSADYAVYDPVTGNTSTVTISHDTCNFCYDRSEYICHGQQYTLLSGELCNMIECATHEDCPNLFYKCLSRNDYCLGRCYFYTWGILLVIFSSLVGIGSIVFCGMRRCAANARVREAARQGAMPPDHHAGGEGERERGQELPPLQGYHNLTQPPASVPTPSKDAVRAPD